MTGRFKPAARTYVRPTAGWWKHNPYFRRYMIREGSALFLSVYALILLDGLWALSRGPEAYERWQAALRLPVSILFHLAALILVSYHSYTWFKVMPKTAPELRIDPQAISRGGVVLTIVLSMLILVILRSVTP
jgi:fumarate reductase subunit C